jgi:hypothetical protein
MPINFAMYRNDGGWEISKYQLESVLGLWYWSVKQLGTPQELSQRKMFMSAQQSRRNELASTIRFWVTQKHRIYPSRAEIPNAVDDAALFVQPVAEAIPSERSQLGAMRKEHPTTLSIPLKMSLASLQEDGLADEICLSIPTRSSLLQLMAQDVFGIFISRLTDVFQVC